MKSLNVRNSTPSGAVYCLGLIGALVYYISTSTSFLSGLFGIFKAIFWPAFLVYAAMSNLGM